MILGVSPGFHCALRQVPGDFDQQKMRSMTAAGHRHACMGACRSAHSQSEVWPRQWLVILKAAMQRTHALSCQPMCHVDDARSLHWHLRTGGSQAAASSGSFAIWDCGRSHNERCGLMQMPLGLAVLLPVAGTHIMCDISPRVESVRQHVCRAEKGCVAPVIHLVTTA